TGEVVDDHPGVVRLQEGDEIERAVLNLGQERRHARQPLALEGLAEVIDELRVGVEDRHRCPCRRTEHVDRAFQPSLETWTPGPSRGSETCRGDSERSESY